MCFNGSQYYDNNDFFQKYKSKRETKENPNDTIEKPIFLELVGDVSNLHVLDLGCGDGKFGIELVKKGCGSYTGLEGSTNMYNLATTNLEMYQNKANVLHNTVENWDIPKQKFDLVISRLVIHYIEDIKVLFQKVHNSLRAGGRFIFSIEHPVITSTLQTNGQRTNWLVDNYFHPGIRKQQWLGTTVNKYHRTIEDYFMSLQNSGFKIESLRESAPRRENFENEETYNRRLRIPLFLFLSGSK